MPEIKLLAALQTGVLKSDLIGENGKVLARAGDSIIVAPQTLAACIIMPDGRPLSEIWPQVSLDGHVHSDDQANLVKYSEELTRYATRLAKVEADIAALSAKGETQLGENHE